MRHHLDDGHVWAWRAHRASEKLRRKLVDGTLRYRPEETHKASSEPFRRRQKTRIKLVERARRQQQRDAEVTPLPTKRRAS